MATALTHSTAGANAAMNALLDLLNGGTMVFYSGSPTGATNAAPAGVLVTVTLPNPAFATAASRVKTMNGTPNTVTVSSTGSIQTYRMITTGAACVEEGSVGTSGCDYNMAGGTSVVASGSFVHSSYSCAAFP